MKEKLLYGTIGFIIGSVVGGVAVGTWCRREMKKRLNAVDDPFDDYAEEEEDDDIYDGEDDDDSVLIVCQNGEKLSYPNVKYAIGELTRKIERAEDDVKSVMLYLCNYTPIVYSSLRDTLEFLENFDNFYDEDEEEIDDIINNPYHQLTQQYKDHPRDSDEEVDSDSIYLIDQEEFSKEVSYRDDETLTYYQQDDVLVDSADQVIRDHLAVIGIEGQEAVEKTEQDFLYVSNDVQNKIFEIAVEHKYLYRDLVNGAGE